MLLNQGASRRLCDVPSRRDLHRVGSIAGLGLGLPDLIQAASVTPPSDPSFGRARRCILLFPFGGPSQIDTFDPKPDAPASIRGEFRPIDTAVPCVHVSELFPRLARLADRYTIVRSVTHGDAVHTSAGYTVLTGVRHPRANDVAGATSIRPMLEDHPHLGSVLAYARPAHAGLPPFVAIPEVVRDAGVNEMPGQGPGLLDGRYAPLLYEADTRSGRFPPPDLLSPDLGVSRLDGRRALRERLDRGHLAAEASGQLGDLDAHYQRAFDLLRTPAALRAFDVAAEPMRVRDAYGPHLFGQGCLLARRLVEAGVSLVTV